MGCLLSKNAYCTHIEAEIMELSDPFCLIEDCPNWEEDDEELDEEDDEELDEDDYLTDYDNDFK